MPAASEPPPLPRSWRPLGVRLAVLFFGGTLVVVCAAAWFGFDQDVRDRFTFLQRATIVGFALIYAVAGWAMGRCRVAADEEGLLVVNGFRSRRLDWAQVVAVEMPPGAPWATLDLADGTSISAMGIQGSDGRRARTAVREVRALIDR